MTFPRFYAMLDYWKYSPPVNESVAAFIGIKEPEKQVVHQPIEEFTLIPE